MAKGEEKKISLLSPRVQAVLALVQGLLPVMTAILGGLWIVFTYVGNQQSQETARRELDKQKQSEATVQNQRQLEQQKRENALRLFEARKPFIQKRFDLYNETAAVIGRLVTLDRKSPEWTNSSIRFWQLYWSELSVVEDWDVERAMVVFGEKLKAFQGREGEVGEDLRHAGLSLAHAIRASIQNSWRVE